MSKQINININKTKPLPKHLHRPPEACLLGGSKSSQVDWQWRFTNTGTFRIWEVFLKSLDESKLFKFTTLGRERFNERINDCTVQFWRLEFWPQPPYSKPGILQTHLAPALREGHFLLTSKHAHGCVPAVTAVHTLTYMSKATFSSVPKTCVLPFCPASASLVPVFSFGENELFKQINNPEGSWLRFAQETLKKSTGFTLPLCYARGIFQYNFGLVPYRKPIYTVGMYTK